MLTRRHIRAKVMQSLYALHRNENVDTTAEKRFLEKSMANMYDLFLLNLSLILEVRLFAKDYLEKSKSKYLATEEDINPNIKFIDNVVLIKLENDQNIQDLLEKKKLTDWRKEPLYVQHIWNELRESDLYKTYTQTRTSSFKEDKDFVIEFFKKFIAPNEKVHEYLEDNKLTWMDDLPIVNTAIVKTLKKFKEKSEFKLPKLFKSEDDRDFALELFSKSFNYFEDFDKDIDEKTPNWDRDRLAEIDAILIKMALCEFIYFSSIPVKVTINEYLEISKEYSTPKSSFFINGVLDKLSKKYESEKKLNKKGRGLM